MPEADQVALDAALTGAALFRRDDLVAVVATGKHRGRFLHALTTQHVNDVPDWTASENTLCNAQGRLLATAHMVVEADRIVLWTDKGLADSMIETLLSYRVAERVRLEVDDNLSLLELVGPGATTMLAEQQSSIINIASMAGMLPLSRVVAYSAAKSAVINLTQFLAREWAQRGIRVNAISPGFFPAKQNMKLLFNDDGSYTERGGQIIGHTPMARFGNAEELAGAVVWLAASRASSFVTGQNIVVDGGVSSVTI